MNRLNITLFNIIKNHGILMILYHGFFCVSCRQSFDGQYMGVLQSDAELVISVKIRGKRASRRFFFLNNNEIGDDNVSVTGSLKKKIELFGI